MSSSKHQRKNFDKSRRDFTKRVLAAPFITSGLSAYSQLAHSNSVRTFDVSKYDQILVPKGHGEILSMRDGHHERYPSRNQSMQFIAFFNSHQGLYIQTNDPDAHITDWIVKNGQLRIIFYGPEVEVLVKTIEPKLEHAASIYKDWARRQFWAKKKESVMDDVSFIATAPSSKIENMRKTIPRVIKRFSGGTACFIKKWRRHPFDKMFPDYMPGYPLEMRLFLTELHARDCVPLPYINGCLVDEAMINKDIRNSLIIDSDGNNPFYTNKKSYLKYACPSTTYWMNMILAARKSLVDACGSLSTGIYYDMIAASSPHICYSTKHNHEPGDARAWQSSFRSLLADTPGVIMIEGCAEVYMDLIDVFLMHFHTERNNIVPLWKHVYGDITNAAGWNPKPGGTPDDLSKAVAKANKFGVGYYSSPWNQAIVQVDFMKWGKEDIKWLMN